VSKTVDRAINSGITIELKVGEVIVREPTLEQTLKTLNDLMSLSGKLESLDLEDNTAMIALLMKDKDILAKVEEVTSFCSGLDKKTLRSLGISDWMRLLAAIKEVIDWEELKTLFFKIVPQKNLLNQGEAQ
jgi:hypothetical protein